MFVDVLLPKISVGENIDLLRVGTVTLSYMFKSINNILSWKSSSIFLQTSVTFCPYKVAGKLVSFFATMTVAINRSEEADDTKINDDFGTMIEITKKKTKTASEKNRKRS